MMKNIYLSLAFILLLAGCAHNNLADDVIIDERTDDTKISSSMENEKEVETAVVFRIIDGDTVTVRLKDGTEETVRIVGIDSSEISYEKDKESDCFAQEAKEKLEELLALKSIYMIKNLIGDDRDKYNRLLRFIFVDDKDIGSFMIQHGFAVAYPWFPHEKIDEYKRQENEAKENEMGLWKMCSIK